MEDNNKASDRDQDEAPPVSMSAAKAAIHTYIVDDSSGEDPTEGAAKTDERKKASSSKETLCSEKGETPKGAQENVRENFDHDDEESIDDLEDLQVQPGAEAIRGPDYVNGQSSSKPLDLSQSRPMLVSANLVDVSAELEREAELIRLRREVVEKNSSVEATSIPIAVVDAQSVRRITVSDNDDDDKKQTSESSSRCWSRKLCAMGSILVVVAAVAVALGVVLGSPDNNKDDSFNRVSTCFLKQGAPVPNCTCHASCATCGYYDNPIDDADCLTCADGSTVKPQYLDGAGLCGRDVSEDIPCLAEEYDYDLCLDTHSDACSDCRATQHWKEDISLSCTDLYREMCLMEECCPTCTQEAETFVNCLALVPKEDLNDDLFTEDCVIEECAT